MVNQTRSAKPLHSRLAVPAPDCVSAPVVTSASVLTSAPVHASVPAFALGFLLCMKTMTKTMQNLLCNPLPPLPLA